MSVLTSSRYASLSPKQLVPGFAPAVDAQVRAIAASNTTVYLGGYFSAVGSAARNRLAAVRASDGALLSWAPQPGVGSTAGNRDGNKATSNDVMAMVLAGPNGQVVVGGRFDSLNGTKATGVGALDGETGATRPFAINSYITNQGVNSAIFSLSTPVLRASPFGSSPAGRALPNVRVGSSPTSERRPPGRRHPSPSPVWPCPAPSRAASTAPFLPHREG